MTTFIYLQLLFFSFSIHVSWHFINLNDLLSKLFLWIIRLLAFLFYTSSFSLLNITECLLVNMVNRFFLSTFSFLYHGSVKIFSKWFSFNIFYGHFLWFKKVRNLAHSVRYKTDLLTEKFIFYITYSVLLIYVLCGI